MPFAATTIKQNNGQNKDNRQNTDPPGFAELLAEYDYAPPERGQILESTILRITENELILDVGLKRDTIVPRQDLDRLDEVTRARLTRGQTVKVWVLRPYSRDGDLLVSVNKALELEDWQRAQAVLESGEGVEAEAVGVNRGGLLVRFGRLRGFVPNSHLASIRRSTPATVRDEIKDNLIGQPLRLRVIEVDRRRDRLVMSEREAMREARRRRLEALEVGQVISGPVVNLVDFGAFVDLGGVDGLVHVSRLEHYHVNHPRDVLEVGQEVTVLIADVDVERERVSLDRSALLPDPYDTFLEQHQSDDLVVGTVTNVVEYGLFVRVAEGVEGLLHISNMADLALEHPADLFRQGDEVLVRIVDIDVAQRRIALSTDAVSVQEQEAWMYERQEAETSQSAA